MKRFCMRMFYMDCEVIRWCGDFSKKVTMTRRMGGGGMLRVWR